MDCFSVQSKWTRICCRNSAYHIKRSTSHKWLNTPPLRFIEPSFLLFFLPRLLWIVQAINPRGKMGRVLGFFARLLFYNGRIFSVKQFLCSTSTKATNLACAHYLFFFIIFIIHSFLSYNIFFLFNILHCMIHFFPYASNTLVPVSVSRYFIQLSYLLSMWNFSLWSPASICMRASSAQPA